MERPALEHANELLAPGRRQGVDKLRNILIEVRVTNLERVALCQTGKRAGEIL
jgi:hypothetical protein